MVAATIPEIGGGRSLTLWDLNGLPAARPHPLLLENRQTPRVAVFDR